MTESKTTLPRWSVERIRIIILAFAVTLVAGFGYPWYLATTTIHRATLPVGEINDLTTDVVKFNIPVYLNLSNASEDFIHKSQTALNTKLYSEYPGLKDFWSIELRRVIDHMDESQDYIINFNILPDKEEETFETVFVSPFSKRTDIELTNKVILSNRVEEFLCDTLMNRLFKFEILKFNDLKKGLNTDHIVFPYSSHYNLVFSLFVEDGTPVSWQSEDIIGLMNPLLQQLNHFSNFTISTQIQYYSNLNIPVEEGENLVVKQSDLSTFINYGDWNLNNNDINPTINFILYFPKATYASKSMIIENSKTNSFLIPQWGGVHIFNKKFDVYDDNDHFVIVKDELIPIFETFSSQLFQLLGLPLSDESDITSKSLLMRIDSLTRLSTYKHYTQSIQILKSLVKLTNELNEISIPEITKSFTLDALNNLKRCKDSLTLQQFNDAIIQSSQSLKNSNNAFFEKEIVQQVYFPSEHKLAVFLPLIGPICSMLTMNSIRQIKDWRSKKST